MADSSRSTTKRSFSRPWAYRLFQAVRAARDTFRSAVYESDPYNWPSDPDRPDSGPDALHPISKRMMELHDEMEELMKRAEALCEEQAGLLFREIQAQLLCDDFEGKVRLVVYHGYAFAEEEREAAIVEAVHAGEGDFSEEESRSLEDSDVAGAFLSAWHTDAVMNVL
jgi:hypothetical protein